MTVDVGRRRHAPLHSQPSLSYPAHAHAHAHAQLSHPPLRRFSPTSRAVHCYGCHFCRPHDDQTAADVACTGLVHPVTTALPITSNAEWGWQSTASPLSLADTAHEPTCHTSSHPTCHSLPSLQRRGAAHLVPLSLSVLPLTPLLALAPPILPPPAPSNPVPHRPSQPPPTTATSPLPSNPHMPLPLTPLTPAAPPPPPTPPHCPPPTSPSMTPLIPSTSPPHSPTPTPPTPAAAPAPPFAPPFPHTPSPLPHLPLSRATSAPPSSGPLAPSL